MESPELLPRSIAGRTADQVIAAPGRACLLAQRPGFARPEVVAELLRRSRGARSTSPALALETARAASSLACSIQPSALRSDYEAESFAEMANATRLLGQFWSARRLWDRAFSAFEGGTGDALLLGRMHWSRGVLWLEAGAAEALSEIERGRRILLACGQTDDAADAGISLARCYAAAGRLNRARRLLVAALAEMSPQVHRARAGECLILLALWSAEAGNLAMAVDAMEVAGAAGAIFSSEAGTARRLWAMGRISAYAGDHGIAEGLLLQAQALYQRLGRVYDAGLVQLERGLLAFKLNAFFEAGQLAAEAVSALSSRGPRARRLSGLVAATLERGKMSQPARSAARRLGLSPIWASADSPF